MKLQALGIPSAQIEILSNTGFIAFALTDSQGNYSINNLPVGSYTIVVVANSYQVVTQTFEIQTQKVLNFSLVFILPPLQNISGKIVYKKQGGKRKRVDIIIWSPSTSSNVAEYQVLRNNKLVATVSANDPLKYKSSSKNNKKHTYKVIAIDAAGNESPAAKITFKNNRVKSNQTNCLNIYQ